MISDPQVSSLLCDSMCKAAAHALLPFGVAGAYNILSVSLRPKSLAIALRFGANKFWSV
jgi:hypothetical protein